MSRTSQNRPTDPGVFGFLLQVIAGPGDGLGEESFDIVVCSPQWLASHLADGELRWGRHHLLVHRYDWATLERFLRDQFESVEGETWRDVAEQLVHYGKWEFEDYTP